MKNCELEFGRETIRVRLPAGSDVLALPPVRRLTNPAAAIRASLEDPIGAPPLREVIRAKQRRLGRLPRAVVVVSDTTRPVPYRGPQGILEPLLAVLRRGGVREIEILVATGTHRPLSEAEWHAMLPDRVFEEGIRVRNHVCTDTASLRYLGRTSRGTRAEVNRHYLDADLKILTGLVEPHFMAGASGGPKSICPGLVGRHATWVFHGAALMADEQSTSLVLDGNPCHEESMAVACMAGVDFLVNVTLDGAKRLTGVFSGELRQAHRAAVAAMQKGAVIPFAREYDLVVTHAGFVGINHYQAAKAAVEGSRAVTRGGTMILLARHTEADTVGSANYRRLLGLLRRLGAAGFTRAIRAPGWRFIPDQWEIQMWIRAFRTLGSYRRLVYCAPRLTGQEFRVACIPARDGGVGIAPGPDRDRAEAMVQRAADDFLRVHPRARVAVLRDGPYGVPVRRLPG